jgi:hypothetical protein
MMRQMEEIFLQTPEIQTFGTIVAFGFNGPGLANQGIGFVRLKDDRERNVQTLVDGPGGLRYRA